MRLIGTKYVWGGGIRCILLVLAALKIPNRKKEFL
jgi:hypothetical protein